MVQLHRHQPAFEQAGASLVVIGNGTPNFIAGFRKETGYEGPLYTDPARRVYSALALKRSVAATFSPLSVRRAVAAYRDGFRQKKTKGDPWQQGGVFVANTDGSVAFAYRARRAGDHPSIPDILDALGSST